MFLHSLLIFVKLIQVKRVAFSGLIFTCSFFIDHILWKVNYPPVSKNYPPCDPPAAASLVPPAPACPLTGVSCAPDAPDGAPGPRGVSAPGTGDQADDVGGNIPPRWSPCKSPSARAHSILHTTLLTAAVPPPD